MMEHCLGFDQLARRWNVSKRTVEREHSRGRFAAFKIGGQWRVKISEILRVEHDRRTQVATITHL